MLAWRIAFRTALLNAAGSLVDDRVYYGWPQKDFVAPAITFFVVVDIAGMETGPNDVLVQIDLWADSVIVLAQIREAIRVQMDDLPFTIPGATHVFFHERSARDLPNEPDARVQRLTLEYRSMFWRG